MDTATRAPIGRAFADPVLSSQRCFRAILASLSEPGTIHRLDEPIEAPAGIGASAVQALLTLADQETRVWLSPSFAGATHYLRFHCGAPLVAAPADAAFALLDARSPGAAIADFDAGDDRYPDRSATLIIACDSLVGGLPVGLAGPGIEGTRTIAPAGLDRAFWQQMIANHRRYPLGVDVLLAAGESTLALPRSTAISLPGEAP